MRKNLLYAAMFVAAAMAGCTEQEVAETRYLASDKAETELFVSDKNDRPIPSGSMVRGAKVVAYPSSTIRDDKVRYVKTEIDGETYYVAERNLATDPRGAVLEKSVYVRTPATIIKNHKTSEIAGFADKKSALEVIGYDSLRADGTVATYKVRTGGKEGYVYGKYTVFTPEEAARRYKPELYDSVHMAVKNSFGGGEAIGCDFFPVDKPQFPRNRMPRSCYSLYLNTSPGVLSNIDAYIALAKRTRINTFVIDIKDNECPGYKAEAMKLYSPTNYRRAGNHEALYRKVVKKLHEEGFYVVGRITCFKDSYFVADNKSSAITEKATGEPFKHNKAYWPSAYDRRVWQFNVALARESIRKIGFNEINFDYVRFPDRMTSVEDLIDYHNTYGETKVQAIQRFVAYAVDEIHKEGAYVSIDVFGESANPGYTTAYGQYWPALSNIADVMCGMPYPDHFANHYYGISEPWNHPYEILNAWGRRVQDRQSVTPTPAIVRTWVQAYNVLRHVDRNGIAYDAENVEKEIRALFDAGLTGGYTTWLSSSNLEKYLKQEAAFRIDYLAESRNRTAQNGSDKTEE